MAKMVPDLITYEEAAARLKCSTRKLQRMVAREVFGKARVGKKSCVFTDEVDAYIEGLTRGNSGEVAVKNFRIIQGRIKRR